MRLLRVPATHWRRVVHVVPGLADLFSRHGVGATPAELGGADVDVRQQRYDLNAFRPSGGVRLNEIAGGGPERSTHWERRAVACDSRGEVSRSVKIAGGRRPLYLAHWVVSAVALDSVGVGWP